MKFQKLSLGLGQVLQENFVRHGSTFPDSGSFNFPELFPSPIRNIGFELLDPYAPRIQSKAGLEVRDFIPSQESRFGSVPCCKIIILSLVFRFTCWRLFCP